MDEFIAVASVFGAIVVTLVYLLFLDQFRSVSRKTAGPGRLAATLVGALVIGLAFPASWMFAASRISPGILTSGGAQLFLLAASACLAFVPIFIGKPGTPVPMHVHVVTALSLIIVMLSLAASFLTIAAAG